MEGAARSLMSVFERTTLDNGLRLLTAAMPQVASTTCFIFLSAGSRYETAETNGIAHFAEHMFFKGTERRPTARDIGMAIDGIGGEFNAFTGKEYTGYYVKCASQHQGIALDVLTDMLRHSNFAEEEIEREKGVIVEEMNMYFDTPRDFIGGVYEDLLYGDQPLGWDIIGRKETVRAATRETFFDYLTRWYKPSRMVVGIAGRLSGDVRAEVERLLGDLEPGEAGPRPPLEPLPNGSGPRVKVHTKQSDQAHLILGAPSRPIDHPDRYILQVLTTVVDQLKRVVDEAVPADELEKAKNFAKGRFVLQLENPQGLILFGLRREVLEGQAVEPDEVLDAIDAVTAEDVQRVAQEVLGSNALRLAVIGPFDDPERFEKLLAV